MIAQSAGRFARALVLALALCYLRCATSQAPPTQQHSELSSGELRVAYGEVTNYIGDMACGLTRMDNYFTLHIAGIDFAAHPGYCGQCIAISCADPQYCANSAVDSVTLAVVDDCPGCGPNVISTGSFVPRELTGKAMPQSGSLDILWRFTDCTGYGRVWGPPATAPMRLMPAALLINEAINGSDDELSSPSFQQQQAQQPRQPQQPEEEEQQQQGIVQTRVEQSRAATERNEQQPSGLMTLPSAAPAEAPAEEPQPIVEDRERDVAALVVEEVMAPAPEPEPSTEAPSTATQEPIDDLRDTESMQVNDAPSTTTAPEPDSESESTSPENVSLSVTNDGVDDSYQSSMAVLMPAPAPEAEEMAMGVLVEEAATIGEESLEQQEQEEEPTQQQVSIESPKPEEVKVADDEDIDSRPPAPVLAADGHNNDDAGTENAGPTAAASESEREFLSRQGQNVGKGPVIEEPPTESAPSARGKAMRGYYDDMNGKAMGALACGYETVSPHFKSHFAAVNMQNWPGSGGGIPVKGACGACIAIRCSRRLHCPLGGEIIAQVVDDCGSCGKGDVLLNPAAMKELTGRDNGQTKRVTWRATSCRDLTVGTIRMKIGPGSGDYWQQLSFSNAAQQVVDVEVNANRLKAVDAPQGSWWAWQRDDGAKLNTSLPLRVAVRGQDGSMSGVLVEKWESQDLGIQI